MEQLLIGRREAAKLLGLCVRTVDTLIARGELRVRRVGRRVLIHHRDLEKFAARNDSRIQRAGAKN